MLTHGLCSRDENFKVLCLAREIFGCTRAFPSVEQSVLVHGTINSCNSQFVVQVWTDNCAVVCA